MSYPNLFIVSYGRTGSTALMAVLNAIPGYLIRGENADLVGHLMAIADDLRPHASVRAAGPSDAWFGGENYTDAALVSPFRQFVDRIVLGSTPPADVRCYGFKEIRYGLTDVDAKLAFLARLYPGAAFLFSVRDSARVARSAFQQGVEPDYLDAIRDKFSELARGPDCFLVSHEELVDDADKLLPRLFDFLGEPYDAARIKGLLAKPHGYSVLGPEGFLTDFPFYVRAGSRPTGIAMLYINRFERSPRSVVVGGFVRSDQPDLFPSLRERSGRGLRFVKQEAAMRSRDGAQMPATNFLIEIECPPAIERLDIMLPGGESLFELRSLRHYGRDLGRPA